MLVLGLDVGGTASRAVLADAAGDPLGYGVAGGGNPTAYPTEQAASAVGTALVAALAGQDPAAVHACVIGLAGGGRLADPAVRAVFDAVWRDAGLRCEPILAGDTEVAFAAGTPEPDGTVLIAGTGAAAAMIRDHRNVRTADAYGWLIGDEGSGFWLGRAAVHATLRVLDGHAPARVLDGLVLDAFAVSGRRPDRGGLIDAVYAAPPVTLARLAPLVDAAARAGDPVATGLVDAAAERLVATLAAVRADDTGPIVLAGGLLAGGGAVAEAVRDRMAHQWTAPALVAAGAYAGASGAAWLALRELPEVSGPAAAAAHASLTGG